MIGALGRKDLFGADAEMPRILGEAEGKYLTLIDCYEANYRGNLRRSSPPTQRIHANHAFVGALFDPPEELAFSKMFIGLEDLTAWIGRTGIQERPHINEGRFDKHTPEATRLPDDEARLDGYTLKLWHQVNWKQTRYREGTLSERHRFTIVPDELTGWRDLLKIAADLADLLSAAFHFPVAYDAICFEHPDAYSQHGEERHHHQIDIHAQWQTQLGTRDKPPTHHQMTFSFDDIGGMDGVARWLSVASKHRRAISRMMATRRRTGMYVEDRFMNCIAAAEGLHRKHVTRRKRTLAERLTGLLDLAGDEFKTALPNHEAWVQIVKGERNDLAHHFDQRATNEHPVHLYLAASTYWLVLLCLLRIMPAPSQALERLASHEQFEWDMRHTRELVDRLSRTE